MTAAPESDDPPACGYALLAQGRIGDALALLHAAEADAPLDAALQQALAAAYTAADDRVRAAAARVAAAALDARAPLPIFNLATGYFMHGQMQPAEKWYRVALQLDPELAIAHQNLASILRSDGRLAEAQHHLELAYAKQWIFVEPADDAVATVLLTCSSGIGNVPIDALLPPRRVARIKCFVDYARLDGEAEPARIPRHDVVFNAIGDPDVPAASDPRLLRIAAHGERPLLNRPQAVAHTRRDVLPALLDGIDGVVVPPVRRIELRRAGAAALAAALADVPVGTSAGGAAADGLRYPLILRPAASHGGDDVALADDRAAVERAGPALTGADAVYATAYRDYRSADGHFRKYRTIFVDRRPYPYHLAIARHWLVHYFSAGMRGEAWKREEESRFLDDPAQAIGAAAWRALEAVGRRLDLDYAGIDFSVLPGGALLVFEANATMLVHPERENGPLAHKNRYVDEIADAFLQMIVERARST